MTNYKKKIKNMGQRAIDSNPTSVSYEDCWSLHTRLDGIIAEHLRAFLHLAKTHPYSGTPGIISEKYRYDKDEHRTHQEWLKILRKMLYAFFGYKDKHDTIKVTCFCYKIKHLSIDDKRHIR